MTNTIELAASLNSSGSLQTFDEEARLSGDMVMPAQFYPAASATPC
jgi:hypothetical protein